MKKNTAILLCMVLTFYGGYTLPEIMFQHIMLQKVNKTGKLPTCSLVSHTGDERQCGGRCRQEPDCVYYLYKQQGCGSVVGCVLCVNETTGAGAQLSADAVNGVEFVHVKLGSCELYGLCPPVSDCSELLYLGYITSGVYPITLSSGDKINVYCDMETQGGGWTVFQRRMDGSEDFFRTWADYEAGFGNLSGEFWLGNKAISAITSQKAHSMRMELSDFSYTFVYSVYEDFKVDAHDSYRMAYTTYKGNIEDGFATRGNNSRFSTMDRDNDLYIDSCAQKYKGGWWYGSCHEANLNGLYLRGQHSEFAVGVNYLHFRGHSYSLRFTEMKLRPKGFQPPVSVYPYHYGSLPQRDCSDYRDQGFTHSGVYPITTRGRKQKKFDVYCDMETDGGGWMVFQRRKDGSEDFYRDYATYQEGFGSVNNEFWLGNDKISYVTEQGPYELRIDMETVDNNMRYAEYLSFSISRDEGYLLRVTDYSGDAGDCMNLHNGMRWTTHDKDQDVHSTANCAQSNQGAWWFVDCHCANLNGLYSSVKYGKGINWTPVTGLFQSLKFVEMKIRLAGYKVPQ